MHSPTLQGQAYRHVSFHAGHRTQIYVWSAFFHSSTVRKVCTAASKCRSCDGGSLSPVRLPSPLESVKDATASGPWRVVRVKQAANHVRWIRALRAQRDPITSLSGVQSHWGKRDTYREAELRKAAAVDWPPELATPGTSNYRCPPAQHSETLPSLPFILSRVQTSIFQPLLAFPPRGFQLLHQLLSNPPFRFQRCRSRPRPALRRRRGAVRADTRLPEFSLRRIITRTGGHPAVRRTRSPTLPSATAQYINQAGHSDCGESFPTVQLSRYPTRLLPPSSSSNGDDPDAALRPITIDIRNDYRTRSGIRKPVT